MSRKFWDWVKNEDETRTLYLEGAIAEETWYGDEITPKQFKNHIVLCYSVLLTRIALNLFPV